MRNNDKTKARAEEREKNYPVPSVVREKNIGWIKRLFTAWRVSHAERRADVEPNGRKPGKKTPRRTKHQW